MLHRINSWNFIHRYWGNAVYRAHYSFLLFYIKSFDPFLLFRNMYKNVIRIGEWEVQKKKRKTILKYICVIFSIQHIQKHVCQETDVRFNHEHNSLLFTNGICYFMKVIPISVHHLHHYSLKNSFLRKHTLDFLTIFATLSSPNWLLTMQTSAVTSWTIFKDL